MDDISKENEWQHLKTLENNNIKVFQRAELPKGPSACRNIGVEKSSGKYIVFLDSDDQLAHYCLKQRIDFMEANPALKMGIFNMLKFEAKPGDRKDIFNQHFNSSEDNLRNFLRLNIPFQVTSAIWEKPFLQNLGGFNENMTYAEDPELHARAFLKARDEIKVLNDSRPDAFYKMPSAGHENTSPISDNSMRGRMDFVKNIYSIILATKGLTTTEIKNYKEDLSKAYSNIVSLSFNDSGIRLPKEFEKFSAYCYEHKIINRGQIVLSTAIIRVWERENSFLKFFHLKGLLSKLFLKLG